METQSMIELQEKLRIAAHFNTERTFPHLFQLLGYRQRLAQEMLKSGDLFTPDRDNALVETWEYVNSNILKILGI
jgi:hypothetical protein